MGKYVQKFILVEISTHLCCVLCFLFSFLHFYFLCFIYKKYKNIEDQLIMVYIICLFFKDNLDTI
jgi:hypothetical protein